MPLAAACACTLRPYPAPRAAALTEDSGLFGELPEFDSMAVATVLTEMEDRLGIIIDDDEIDDDEFQRRPTVYTGPEPLPASPIKYLRRSDLMPHR